MQQSKERGGPLIFSKERENVQYNSIMSLPGAPAGVSFQNVSPFVARESFSQLFSFEKLFEHLPVLKSNTIIKVLIACL